MRDRFRLIFSVRDPGGVGHILALLDEFRIDGRFEVVLVAGDPACELLRRAGEDPHRFSAAVSEPQVAADALAEARALLGNLKPDAILVSLSSFGVGVDEALLAVSDVPSFAMQDFWGDVNLGLGKPADLYFVMDEFAERLTRSKWGVEAMAVGSPKHARYSRLDIQGLRVRGRQQVGVGVSAKVVGFFGQSPEIPGHEQAFADLIACLARMAAKPMLLLREHPKFPGLSRQHWNIASDAGLEVRDVSGSGPVEQWLAVCDVVATPFSACGLDHAYLSAFSTEPIGSVVYLMTTPEIRTFAVEEAGMDRFPIVAEGMGVVAESAEEASRCLDSSLNGGFVKTYFEACGKLSALDSFPRILDAVGLGVASPTSVIPRTTCR